MESEQFPDTRPQPRRRPIRVLLVDDNPEFLASAEEFLSVDPQLQVVGCAMCGCRAVEQVDQLRPDLVLMDLAMPGMSGLDATRQIKARPDAPRVVIMTLYRTLEYRAAADSVGADGFLAKSEFSVELRHLIHMLFDEITASPSVSRKVGDGAG